MKRRRLRKLVPDDDLICRRAAGESLRQLACPGYGVQHSALSRYFRRPEVAKQLREARQVLRAAERAAAARARATRQLEREVERKAKEERKLERERARRERELAARQAQARTPVERWLNEHDLPLPTTRTDNRRNDDKAAQVVAEGGGMEALVEVTGSRTAENVDRGIDPRIVEQALQNDALRRAQPPPS